MKGATAACLCSTIRAVLVVLLLGLAWGASAQVCTFNTPPSGITFGPLDPSSTVTQTAQVNATVRCTASGSPGWQFSGANGNAPLRMKHATQNAFIPYTVAAAFVSTGGGNQRWTVTATVLGQNYQNALGGSYSDILTVTIIP